MAARAAVMTLPEVLYHYRYHLHSSSLKNDPARPGIGETTMASLYSQGAMRLWAGDRAAIIDDVLSDRTTRWSLNKLMIAGWAFWADLHPSSLRSLSKTVVRIRDAVAGRRISDGRLYEWRFE